MKIGFEFFFFFRKKKIQETLEKKKKQNAKAQKIVEMLCELKIDEQWFLDNVCNLKLVGSNFDNFFFLMIIFF